MDPGRSIEAMEGSVFEFLAGLVNNRIGDAASDALAAGVQNMLVEQLGPLADAAVLKLRGILLDAVTGEPPAQLKAELELLLGMQITDDVVRKFWTAIVRAIAAEPADRPRVQLHVVPERESTDGSTDRAAGDVASDASSPVT